MVKITVTVLGMQCPMCEAHANDAIKAKMKVKRVSSSHTAKQTVIIAESANEALIKEAIEGCGYQVTDIVVEPYQKEGFLQKLFRK